MPSNKLSETVLKAFKKAILAVKKKHKENNVPMYVSENGKVKKLDLNKKK